MTTPSQAAASREPRLVFTGPTNEVKPTGQVINFDDLRRRRAAGVPGDHFFVIAMFFHVPDPTIPVDDLECGPGNIVGFNPVRCIVCDRPWTDEDQASGKPIPPCEVKADDQTT